jgi:hypothetical protein
MSRKTDVTPVNPEHIALAVEYCSQVLAGTIPASKFVRQACQRQLDQIAKA